MGFFCFLFCSVKQVFIRQPNNISLSSHKVKICFTPVNLYCENLAHVSVYLVLKAVCIATVWQINCFLAVPLIYFRTNSPSYQWIFLYRCWDWFKYLYIILFPCLFLCVFADCVSGVDWLVEHCPAGQHSSLAASDGAEWEYWAQQSPSWYSRPTRLWVRSGSWPRPGPYVRAWVWYGTWFSTRTGRRESWFTQKLCNQEQKSWNLPWPS